MVRKVLLALSFALVSALAAGNEAPLAADDPAVEKRMVQIAEELRCLVCQNQTIADSHADLAIDLKNQVREMIHQGKTDKEIKAYMVERYGDFVLYRPPVKTTTWLLWVGPFVLLVAGLVVLIVKLRNRSRRIQAEQAILSEDQRSRAATLLESDSALGDRS